MAEIIKLLNFKRFGAFHKNFTTESNKVAHDY